jgi:hypothetical protein
MKYNIFPIWSILLNGLVVMPLKGLMVMPYF